MNHVQTSAAAVPRAAQPPDGFLRATAWHLRTSTRSLGAGVLLILSGCSSVVGRNYQEPAASVPTAYSEPVTPGIRPLANWWESFEDPRLNDLVREGLAANSAIRIAFTRLDEERALLGIAEAAYGPRIGASAGVTRTELSKHSFIPFPIPPYTDYQAGFDASWEIDIWGAVRREREGAVADLHAQEWTVADVANTVSSEIVRVYSDCLVAQERCAIARELVTSYQKAHDTLALRLRAGLIPQTAILQSDEALAHAQAGLPALVDQDARDRHRLAVLLGKDPGSVDALLTIPHPLYDVPTVLAVGVPADLIRHRPDVRTAERHLASATARVGVAEADMYPRLSLSGNFGLDSINREKFLSRSSLTWGFGPAISWNLIDWGRIRNTIRLADKQVVEADIVYTATILTAEQDVADALSALHADELTITALTNEHAQASTTEALEKELQKNGLSENIAVRTRQQSSLQIGDALVQARGQRVMHIIQLAKALGGGWDAEARPLHDAQVGKKPLADATSTGSSTTTGRTAP